MEDRASWCDLYNYTMPIALFAHFFCSCKSIRTFVWALPALGENSWGFDGGQHILLGQWNNLGVKNYHAKIQAASLNAPSRILISDGLNHLQKCQFLSTMRGSSGVIWVPEQSAETIHPLQRAKIIPKTAQPPGADICTLINLTWTWLNFDTETLSWLQRCRFLHVQGKVQLPS